MKQDEHNPEYEMPGNPLLGIAAVLVIYFFTFAGIWLVRSCS